MKKLVVLLITSFMVNISLSFLYFKPSFTVIHQENSNSRETYFTIHSIKDAQKYSKGIGIKVGVMDSFFGYEKHKDLYAGGKDFIDNKKFFNEIDEHGYWMASVLKEIAPDCEIYALGIYNSNADEDRRVESMIQAINWAIENKIDILTLSQSLISDKNRDRLDEAVNEAINKNIVTTFIHYDNPLNILPFGLFSYNGDVYGREPDINVFHYDYNTLFVEQFLKFQTSNDIERSGMNPPHLSFSSMSPVTAGFVALLKAINNTLSPNEYKEILVKSSYNTEFIGGDDWEKGNCPRVVDMTKAIEYIMTNY